MPSRLIELLVVTFYLFYEWIKTMSLMSIPRWVAAGMFTIGLLNIFGIGEEMKQLEYGESQFRHAAALIVSGVVCLVGAWRYAKRDF